MEMARTLVAVFDNQDEAKQALDALSTGGFSTSQARLTSPQNEPDSAAAGESKREESLGEKVAEFFGFGDDANESTYSEARRRGSFVLTVDVESDEQADRAFTIIDAYHPVDIDARTAEWRESGWQPGAQGGETAIPVVEEQLEVGKREVQRGGIRVITRAIERPVEEKVSLREEHASIKRRPADRPATGSETAFKEQSFEVQGTAEEVVVAKTARVVEEVVIGKESSTRDQTIKDSVRKTEVEVEQLGKGSKSKRYGGQERRRSSGGFSGMERRSA